VPGKRDAEYYKKRLQREHPGIFADLVAGAYPSVRAAALTAGLVKPRSALSELKSAWRKATPAQKRQFLSWARSGSLPVTSAASLPTAAFDADGSLLPWARERILEIMDRRKIGQTAVMRELGSSPLNVSLWSAVSNKTKVRQPNLRHAVDKWLADHARR